MTFPDRRRFLHELRCRYAPILKSAARARVVYSTHPPTVANLFVYTNNHRNPLALVGQYYETFRIDVTNP